MYLWLQGRGDAWSLTRLWRRPWPQGAQDIGTWQSVFDLVIAAAVITNGAMIVFTMDLLNDYSTYNQFWIFIGFQWVVFTIQTVIRMSIPDTPYEVQIQIDRAKFMNSHLIFKEKIESIEDLQEEFQHRFPNSRPWSIKSIDALDINSLVKESIDAP